MWDLKSFAEDQIYYINVLKFSNFFKTSISQTGYPTNKSVPILPD